MRTDREQALEERINRLLGELAAKELERMRAAEWAYKLQTATRRVYDDVGPPGDFGYETRTGKALKQLYDTYNDSLRGLTTAQSMSALAQCLSVLLRMIPDAIAEHGLEPCTDEEHNAAIGAAARMLHGDDTSAWPPGARQAAAGEYP